MNEPETGLDGARHEIDAAAARLRRLKRSLDSPARQPPRFERWQALRRLLESAERFLSGWSAQAAEPQASTPEQLRRRSEMEARGLRAETALAQLEERQQRLDEERQRCLSELERVCEGWRLLRRDLAYPASPADQRGLNCALEKLQRVEAAAERAFDEERLAQREAESSDRLWRWIVSVGFPTFEQRLMDADATQTLPTLRRIVHDLDRRWRSLRSAWGQRLGASAREDSFDEIQRREDAQRGAYNAKLEAVKSVFAQRQAQLMQERARLEGEVEAWQGNFAQSRAENARLQARVGELQSAGAASDKKLEIVRERLIEFSKALKATRLDVVKARMERDQSLQAFNEGQAADLKRQRELKTAAERIEAFSQTLEATRKQYLQALEEAEARHSQALEAEKAQHSKTLEVTGALAAAKERDSEWSQALDAAEERVLQTSRALEAANQQISKLTLALEAALGPKKT